MKYHLTKQITISGLTAALAVVIMSLIGLLGITTYICPVLCMLLLSILVRLCSRKVCWCWYLVVSILSVLFAPDKEAVAVFLFFGYYPILRPQINRSKFAIVWKVLLFNAAMITMYGILLYVIGLPELSAEMYEFGIIGAIIFLALGNITFFLLDLLLNRMDRRW